MTDEELDRTLGERRKELFNLRFRNSTGELENTARLGDARRSLARALTIAGERGLDIERELRKV